MTEGVKTIIYPVTDLAKAKALYGTLLGVKPYMDEP
jgi:extradiol dioxygenase family protein